MHNLTESLTFLAFARQTLAEAVTKNESKDFLLNEATDYEVLHALVTGKFPELRENEEEESALMESLKTFVLENKNTFSTFLGPDAVSTFILEVDIISPYKISSSFKFVEESLVPKGEVITEIDWKRVKGFPGKAKESIVGAAKTVAAAPGKAKEQFKIGYKPSPIQKDPGKIRRALTGLRTAAGTKEGKVTGASALAIAAIASFAAHKLYQRYFSQIAKQCRKSTDRKACFQKAKNTALKAKATALKSSMATCSKSKEPAKCKESIHAKIAKVESKIR